MKGKGIVHALEGNILIKKILAHEDLFCNDPKFVQKAKKDVKRDVEKNQPILAVVGAQPCQSQ